MLTKRIIPCLDVRDGKVVKGVQFKNHVILGDVIDLTLRYRDEGADELVFYDITASSEQRQVAPHWVEKVGRVLDIPFCIAGGIRDLDSANRLLNAGAEKISINTPALENPELISILAQRFGSQCIVVGVDSRQENDDYVVYKLTGSEKTIKKAKRKTLAWLQEVEQRGAGEIVLNCINQDGVGRGYDLTQLKLARTATRLPLIASGGAGSMEDFHKVFTSTHCDGALAAGVFHRQQIAIPDLKRYLKERNHEVRL